MAYDIRVIGQVKAFEDKDVETAISKFRNWMVDQKPKKMDFTTCSHNGKFVITVVFVA